MAKIGQKFSLTECCNYPSDSRPTREKEIEREFLAEERRIDKVSSCSVSELKKTLRDLNNKNKELNDEKWKNEQLNQQVSNTEHM